MSTTEKPENGGAPRPGSARAKLEAFDRAQKGKRLWTTRTVVLGVILVLTVLIMMVFEREGGDVDWFDLPKDAAFFAREGRWADFRESLADDFEIEGSDLDKAGLVALIESRAQGVVGVGGYATIPHTFARSGDEAKLSFWVIYSRGDISREETIPLVQTWLVQLDVERDDGRWRARRARVRETVGIGSSLDTEPK